MYDPSRKIWKRSKEFEINRKNYCAVQMNDSLMIIGGHGNSRSDASDVVNRSWCVFYSSSVCMMLNWLIFQVNLIDFQTGNMQVLSSLHQARYNAAAVVIHRTVASDVFVIGGTGPKVLGTVEMCVLYNFFVNISILIYSIPILTIHTLHCFTARALYGIWSKF